jgi:hypothetical protein
MQTTTTPKASAPAEGARPRAVLQTLLARPAALLLVLLMAVGSVVLWLGVPFFWIWFASHIVKTSQPTLGPYLLIIVALPISMWIIGKLLFRMNNLYSRLTGQSYEVKVQLPWHRSMRGERVVRRQSTVLEVVMIGSVSLALIAFAIWFFFFAGSSLPNA